MRTHLPAAWVVVGCLALSLGGCATRAPAPPEPVVVVPEVHVVQRDETLYRIATRHGLDWRDVALRNGIGPPYLIYPGQRLRLTGSAQLPRGPSPEAGASARTTGPTVPGQGTGSSGPAGASSRPPAQAAPPPSTAGSPARPLPPRPAPPPPSAGSAAPQWQWPADGPVLRAFSNSSVTRRGIAIGGRRGDDVRAAAAGEVVYAGSGLVGYGRLIILKHDARFISAYGHNEELLVREGDVVRAGQRIARLGDSGADRPMLHFEIRVDGTPVDPTRYLPRR
jgi:lipoprotein NlpD